MLKVFARLPRVGVLGPMARKEPPTKQPNCMSDVSSMATCTVVSVREFLEAEIWLPNPADQHFRIKLWVI